VRRSRLLRLVSFRDKIMSIAKESGFEIYVLLGRKANGKGARGKVAVKYRDNAGNTCTGRGQMPRWMVAATKGGKAKRDDFLIAQPLEPCLLQTSEKRL
jgi:DNA-binding protein H-NS